MILVTGCGPIGSELVEALASVDEVKCACDKEHPTPGSVCLAYDVENNEDIVRLMNEIKPAKLILTEEISNIEYCERNRMDAMKFNTRGTRFFVEEGNKINARITYLSSAYVFDGRKSGGLYTESDKVNPINVYGETKLMGEVAVDKSPEHLTFRVGELYGDYRDNFVRSVHDSLKFGIKMELARDMYFSPIFIDDAVNAIRTLTKENIVGLYNLAGPDRISHYEMGLKVAKVFGLKEEYIVPLSADELGMTVRMPRDISLDVSKLATMVKINGIDEGLMAMKKSMGE